MALSSARRVEQFARAAESRGAQFRIIQCVCAEKTALDRIARGHGGAPRGRPGGEAVPRDRERFEPIAHPFLTVDTDENPALSLALTRSFPVYLTWIKASSSSRLSAPAPAARSSTSWAGWSAGTPLQ